MIKPTAKLTIRRLPLSLIQVWECEQRYPERVMLYVNLLNTHPGEDAGLLSVMPSGTHPGLYALLDGHHRYCAYILTGRKNALCLIIEEP